MNKYFDSAIVITSICSLGLATLLTAKDTIAYPESNTVKDIQLERLDHSLAVSLQNLETVTLPINTDSTKTPQELQPKPISATAINLIKEFEGFESQAYIDTDGTPVIGYGLSKISGEAVQLGDHISPKQADAALNTQLQEIHQELDRAVKVELSDRQLSALASLSFNVGVNAIENSTLIKKLNTGDYTGAANEFLRWDKANIRGRLVQMPGLTRRRQAERQLFLHQNS